MVRLYRIFHDFFSRPFIATKPLRHEEKRLSRNFFVPSSRFGKNPIGTIFVTKSNNSWHILSQNHAMFINPVLNNNLHIKVKHDVYVAKNLFFH